VRGGVGIETPDRAIPPLDTMSHHHSVLGHIDEDLFILSDNVVPALLTLSWR
jgi:hypothetical protein